MTQPHRPTENTRASKWLRDHGFPYTDHLPFVRSDREFDGGGVYGVEIPAVNSLAILEGIVENLGRQDVYCTRFNETHGSHLLTDHELAQMLTVCREAGYGLLVGLGPRPEYDVKASFYRSSFGLEQGRQINNNDAMMQCVEEAIRLDELGCRGLIVYDFGVLRVLSAMRREGALSAEMVFKTSSHCMPSNPLIAESFHLFGADSVTTSHDLGLPVLQEMRRLAPELVLDVPTDVYPSKGGFIRFYELADLVHVAAPVFLKMGASVQEHPYDKVSSDLVKARVDRVKVGQELFHKIAGDLPRIGRESRHFCLPVLGGSRRKSVPDTHASAIPA